jgi:DNA-binding GntR family transcriptional regulator
MTEIREGAFLREALELAAVSRVASTRSEEQLAQLKRTLRMQTLLVEDQDYAGFYQADEDLHRLIMQFTGYNKLITVANTAWLQVDRARRLLLPTPGRAIESIDEHRAIIEAIENQDADAARDAMKVHLSELVNRLEPLTIEQPTLFKSE